MTIIFFASAEPTMPLEGRTAISDKQIHGLVYLGLTLLAYRASVMVSLGRTLDPAVQALLISALHGIVDEFHQLFVPDRHTELGDWLADVAGALVAVLAIVSIRVLTRKGGTRSVRRREN